MQRKYYDRVESILSVDRLSVYGQDSPGTDVVMARYLWNMAISEALYSCLQMCEVALRNAIHNAMSGLYGQGRWYDSGDLAAWGTLHVKEAKERIAHGGKPITIGRVIAELHFGFWTSLFEDHYERNTRFLPKGIKKVFPDLPKSQHRRKTIKARLERIRQLRNRVFHHERIIHWKDLEAQHGQIIQTIQWISPELAEMALRLDRFLQTYRAGIEPWITKLNHHWPAKP